MPAQVIRSRGVSARLRAAAPRFVVISAPAGFGKTRLVDAFTADRPPLATMVYDCRATPDLLDLTNSVRFALLERVRGRAARQIASSMAEAEELLFEVWRSASGPRTIVFDHAEALLDDRDGHALLERLLAIPQRTRSVVVSSRRAVSLPAASFALPHETIAVGADDLRLDVPEIRVLLEPAGAGGHADAVAGLTGGWPAAVLFLRTCAQDGSLTAVLDDPAGAAAARLHEYIDREVIGGSDTAERAVAFVCAALPSAAETDLDSFLGAELAARGVRSLAGEGLLQRRDNGDCVLQALVAATLCARHAEEVGAMTARIAASFARTAPLRAAPLLATVGDVRGAEIAYGHARAEAPDDQLDFESSLRAARVDRQALLDNLALFNAATQADYYGVDIEDWLAQAQEALRRAGDAAPEETRAVTIMMTVIRFALVGRWDDGHAFLDVERARLPAEDAVVERGFLLLRAMLEAAADRPVDLPALRKRLGGDLAEGYLRALFARRVASSVAALHGRASEALRELEIAYNRAEAYGRRSYVVELAMLACFEAWRAGDDDTARRWYERAGFAADHRTASGREALPRRVPRLRVDRVSGVRDAGDARARLAHRCIIGDRCRAGAAMAGLWAAGGAADTPAAHDGARSRRDRVRRPRRGGRTAARGPRTCGPDALTRVGRRRRRDREP
jgi:hypothetical protein